MTLEQVYNNFISLSQKYIVTPLSTLFNALSSWYWGASAPSTEETAPIQASTTNDESQADQSSVTVETAPIHESAMNHEHQDCAGDCRPPAEPLLCSLTSIQPAILYKAENIEQKQGQKKEKKGQQKKKKK